VTRLRLLLVLLLLAACVDPPREASTVVVAAMDFGAAVGGDGTTFWAAPWPSDARLTGEGRPDLDGFPNPGASDLLGDYIQFGKDTAQGYGLTSPVYFDFSAATTLADWDEDDAETSQSCEGPVRILNVDPDSSELGRCTPAQWVILPSNSTDAFLEPNLIVVQPSWGFPLLPETTYAVYFVDLEALDGFVEGPEALQQALSGASTAPWAASYQPFVEFLAANPTAAGEEGVGDDGAYDPRWIASATVFTTHHPTAEMAIAAAFVAGDPDYPVWNDEEGLVEILEGHEEYHSDYRMWVGAYTARNFQRGEIPYANEGGGLVFENGEIIPQALERIPFVIGMPDPGYEKPKAGWPLILHSHGTTGDEFSHIGAGSFLRPGLLASDRGFISMGIPQPIHGERWPEGSDLAISLNSFNFFNPESGSSMFRQGALDLLSQVQFVLRSMTEGGDVVLAMPELEIDPDNIFFMGHSQGGLTGSLALPFDEHIKAFVLSGAGGGLPMTVMRREKPLVIRDLLAQRLGEPPGLALFEQHPSVGLVGWIGELTDPLVYAPEWNRRATRPPVSILLFEGIQDEQTPAGTSEALAVAAGLPVARPFREQEPFGLDLRGREALRLPYSANAEAPDGTPVTLGFAQFDDDHFVVFNDLNAALLWVDFLKSIARNGGPGLLGEDES
jgi:predicted esterase